MDPNAATNAFLGAQIKQSPPLDGTASAANAIARVKYTHDAMIDLVITNPAISQNEIAKHFGYKPAWVSRIFNSDAFQARLAQRKSDVVDPVLSLSMDERIKAMAAKSLDIIQDKLEQSPTIDHAFKAFELSSKALGYGAKAANVAVQQNFIVPMPAKAASAQEWVANRQGGQAGQVVDVEPTA